MGLSLTGSGTPGLGGEGRSLRWICGEDGRWLRDGWERGELDKSKRWTPRVFTARAAGFCRLQCGDCGEHISAHRAGTAHSHQQARKSKQVSHKETWIWLKLLQQQHFALVECVGRLCCVEGFSNGAAGGKDASLSSFFYSGDCVKAVPVFERQSFN